MSKLELENIGRLARSPIMTHFFSSLLGVGFDSKREKSLNKILVVSTLFLQIGSGYTTWAGLSQYVPSLVAVLITLAIQGLLFASSWRLGASMYSRNFKFSLLAIYTITMATSVFFSYSGLLERVYTPDRREEDQLQRIRLASDVIMTDVNQQLDARLMATAAACRRSLSVWHDHVNSRAVTHLAPLRLQSRRYKAEHDKIAARSALEIDAGGTIVSINGQKFISPKGHGPLAKEYESQAFSVLYDKLGPLQSDLAEKERSLEEFNSLIGNMMGSDTALNPENLSALATDLTSVSSAFSDSSTTFPIMPAGLREKVFEYRQIYSARNSKDLTTAILAANNAAEIKNEVYSYLSGLTFLDGRYRQRLFAKIALVGRYEGANVHQFVLAIGELSNWNPLAIGSLLVAISIDILVLFCGLMGARPDSYLDMKNPDDLFDVQESAVETVLSLDLESAKSLDKLDPFIRRAIEILRRSRPSVEFAYKGLPALLTQQDISEMNMSKELGVLFALELAKELPDGRVGIRTRLILWLADQIWRHTESLATAESLRNSFNFLGDDK